MADDYLDDFLKSDENYNEEYLDIDAKVTFTDFGKVNIEFRNINVMDIDLLFKHLGTKEARIHFMESIVKAMAKKVLDRPIPYSLTEE